jgi:3-dehydro-L-gulonate 2-dehydrogenase
MVDGAMAQFSYGAIESAKLTGRKLPVPGGFDRNGDLTTDPAEIEKTWRVLPIGYWKGSGFSIVMDMIAACLSNGNTTCQVGKLSEDEYALSQIFIAINISGVCANSQAVIQSVIDDIKASERVDSAQEILYPNEKENAVRQDNLKNGIPVNDTVWKQIHNL